MPDCASRRQDEHVRVERFDPRVHLFVDEVLDEAVRSVLPRLTGRLDDFGLARVAFRRGGRIVQQVLVVLAGLAALEPGAILAPGAVLHLSHIGTGFRAGGNLRLWRSRLQMAAEDRVFVRGISGEYNLSEELRQLRARPRVRKGAEIEFTGGPQHWNVDYMSPGVGLGQTLHIHLQEYAPGGVSKKHGHVNEAVFYILDGEGAEDHDGIRYEWEAGDIVDRAQQLRAPALQPQ